jgi:GntR family transcriptional repressor for pyruvate dehydrogenase complex
MEKIVRANVTDQIFKLLKAKISDGDWKVGEKIPSETELAEILGVSRMSLRMAIQKLNALGLTETRPGEGTFVKNFSMKPYFNEVMKSNLISTDLSTVNEFHRALEIACIELVLYKKVRKQDLEDLEKLYETMKQALLEERMDDFDEVDMRFHRAIVSMTQNQLFEMVYDAIFDMIFLTIKTSTRQVLERTGNYEELWQHHFEILQGIKTNDLERCIRAEKNAWKQHQTFIATNGLLSHAQQK